jgi:hypothetical protein
MKASSSTLSTASFAASFSIRCSRTIAPSFAAYPPQLTLLLPPPPSQWHGYLGLDILPAAKAFLKEVYMQNFISGMYEHAIMDMRMNGGIKAWSAVAYCPHVSKTGEVLIDNAIDAHPHFVRSTPTMNVAMPDFSCEYWTAYIPADSVPIFKVEFKNWPLYCALTMYDAQGLPLASLHGKQVERYFLNESIHNGAGMDARIFRVPSLTGGRIDESSRAVYINLMKGVSPSAYSGPICACFRVYRPSTVFIIPDSDKPSIYLLPKEEVEAFSPFKNPIDELEHLPVQETAAAMDKGADLEKQFNGLISKHLKPLKPHQFGTQFFHPASVAGLFVNANATYVLCFVPPDKKGLTMKGRTPKFENWRPYYGIMAVDYSTTKTMSTLTFEHFGGWDQEYELFAFRTIGDATEAGYDANNPKHHILLWGTSDVCNGACGLVLRYLHYFESDGVASEDGKAEEEASKASEEQNMLRELDGDALSTYDHVIPGCSTLTFV